MSPIAFWGTIQERRKWQNALDQSRLLFHFRSHGSGHARDHTRSLAGGSCAVGSGLPGARNRGWLALSGSARTALLEGQCAHCCNTGTKLMTPLLIKFSRDDLQRLNAQELIISIIGGPATVSDPFNQRVMVSCMAFEVNTVTLGDWGVYASAQQVTPGS